MWQEAYQSLDKTTQLTLASFNKPAASSAVGTIAADIESNIRRGLGDKNQKKSTKTIGRSVEVLNKFVSAVNSSGSFGLTHTAALPWAIAQSVLEVSDNSTLELSEIF
jgi:hypothetical protein